MNINNDVLVAFGQALMWFEKWKKKLKLPIMLVSIGFALWYLFRFYDATPDWARFFFMFYVWRNVGQAVGKWGVVPRSEVPKP